MRPLVFAVSAFLNLAYLVPISAQELSIPDNGDIVVSHDLSLLPPDVRAMHDKLLEVARAGDIEKLVKIMDAQPMPVTVSFGDPEDKLAYLKTESRDGTGVALMAILANILDAPYAAMESGDGNPIYVWPSLALYEDLRALSNEELIVGYRILGLDGFKAQQEIGNWLDWRLYLGPNGELQAFVAGD